MTAFLLSHTLEALQVIMASPKPSDTIMMHYMRGHKHLGARDRRSISEMVYGIIRYELTLRRIVDEVFSSPREKEKALPGLLLLTYVVRFQPDAIDVAIEHIASDYALSPERLKTDAKRISEFQFPDGDTAESLSWKEALPEWMITRLSALFDPTTLHEAVAALNRPASTTLRVNTLRCTREEAMALLQREDIAVSETPLSPFGLTLKKRQPVFSSLAFKSGKVEIQDEGSQLISLLLNPKPGMKVLDLCAGGGGKTLHLAALMQGKGKLFAYDKYEHRFGNIKDRLRRSGAQNVEVISGDAAFTAFCTRFANSLDRILIDAPCSGSGTLRRNPDLKMKLSEAALSQLPKEQIALLETASHLLKPGGRLCYATCSLFEEENEAVISSFLQAHSSFSLIAVSVAALDIRLPYRLDAFQNRLSGLDVMRLFPHSDDTDGFFSAILEKR